MERLLKRLALVLFALTFSAHAKTLPSCLKAVAEVESRLAANDFNRERDLKNYEYLLKAGSVPGLREFLAVLKEGDLYLDSGSGDAVAVREILKAYPALSAVSVAYKKPGAKGLDEALRLHAGRFQYIDGGKVEDLAARPGSKLNALLGKIALLTDLFGPAAYSSDLDTLFNTYADLLRPGGQALILFWEADTVFSLEDAHGRPSRPTLRELRDLIPVMTGGRLIVREARMQAPEDWPQFEGTVLWLERSQGAEGEPVRVFDTLNITDGTPPKRQIQVLPPAGFHFDREASRDADMKRVEVGFKRAYVPDAFKFRK
jgi:SAM-dependent methyltransferase